MAVGIGPGGAYSYDPNKKKKLADVLGIGGTQGAPESPPIIPPPITSGGTDVTPPASAEEVSAIPSLAGRFMAAGVAPRQPGMGNVSVVLAQAYQQQAQQRALAERMANIKSLPIGAIEAALGFKPSLPKAEGVGAEEAPLIGAEGLTPENVNELIPNIVAGEAVNIPTMIDTLKKWGTLSTGEVISVVKAKDVLTTTMNGLQSEVDLVKAGLKDSRSTQEDFIRAETAINSLERKQRENGKASLRYWVDKGKDIEVEIEVARQTLNNMKRELLSNMVAQGRI